MELKRSASSTQLTEGQFADGSVFFAILCPDMVIAITALVSVAIAFGLTVNLQKNEVYGCGL